MQPKGKKRATLAVRLLNGDENRKTPLLPEPPKPKSAVPEAPSPQCEAAEASLPPNHPPTAKLFAAKGAASAASFRPAYWTYDRAEAEASLAAAPSSETIAASDIAAIAMALSAPIPSAPAPSAPAPSASVSPDVAAAPPIIEAPSWRSLVDDETLWADAPLPVAAFEGPYPCNLTLAAPVIEAPEPDRFEQRAELLATSRTIAGLISDVLDHRDAVTATRSEQVRLSATQGDFVALSPITNTGGRVTAEALIAELQRARRGSVRQYRAPRRSLERPVATMAVVALLSAGLVGLSLWAGASPTRWFATLTAPLLTAEHASQPQHLALARN